METGVKNKALSEGEETAFSEKDFILVFCDRYGIDEVTIKQKLFLPSDGAKEPLTRKRAAVLLHGILTKVIGEPDLADIQPASILRDLYDCRVCVNPIAQMYLKGIMEVFLYPELSDGKKEFLVFDGNGEIGKEEACRCIERLLNREKRIKR